MSLLRLPGLIDPHVHLRDPGQTYKEDFLTGTTAALAGGFTTVLDMPNNKVPITSRQLLEEKMQIAKEEIVCDVGFYFGSMGDNLNEFEKVKDKVLGLKLYLNETTGNMLIDKETLESIFQAWKNSSHTPALRSNGLQKDLPRTQMLRSSERGSLNVRNAKIPNIPIVRSWVRGLPILVHAEGEQLNDVIEVLKETDQRVHVCHVSTQEDLALILRVREAGLPITCGVTPHHLFLTEDDENRLGPYGKMKPKLASKEDVQFLWKNLNMIDVIESDHAPHTKEEKESGFPPFGVPGLETTLPLLLTAVSEHRLNIEDIIRLCSTNPARIFGLQQNPNTYIEIDQNISYTIENRTLYTKCGWSPFNGREVRGKVQKVVIRGTTVFENDSLRVAPGIGKVL